MLAPYKFPAKISTHGWTKDWAAFPKIPVGFQKFRAIQRFCVEGSNKHSDRGHSSNNLELLTDRTFRQARNQLGTPGWAKSFPRRAQIF